MFLLTTATPRISVSYPLCAFHTAWYVVCDEETL